MKNETRTLTGAEALREALDQAMEADERIIVIGEGVPDPKGVFGTTLGLQEKYGERRVFDMPVSENGVTGICIGAALRGLRPIMTHQRIDFSLYAFDQIINNAAKWHYMFGGKLRVPLVIRMIIGRGWGQGAQHSQNLQSLFAHVPGLKVVTPSLPATAKGLLLSSIADDEPVIFIEHRWIHGLKGSVPEALYELPLGQAAIRRTGDTVTVVANSYMTVEALHAADVLAEVGIAAEVIDLLTVRPLDEATIMESVRKTGRLLVVDGSWPYGGVAGEIIARLAMASHGIFKRAPRRLTLPDVPAPSSPALAFQYYPTYREIIEAAYNMIGRSVENLRERWRADDAVKTVAHDVSDPSFTGPF